MPLRLPAYQPIPAPDRGTDLIEVSAAQLQPTQWCVGLAEIWSREKDFAQDTRQQRLDYLRGKPVPLIRSADGAMWMLDRHHRLRGLIGLMVRIPAGFVLAKAITAVDPFGQALRFCSIVGPAAAHLGRQVMGMGVKVALGAAVGLQLLQGTEPAVNGWMLSPQPVSLVAVSYTHLTLPTICSV